MDLADGLFSVTLDIPDTASVLSYYFTDGDSYDYNNNKTYYKLIYGENGEPVRGARFRSIDFMVMAGKSLDEQAAELRKELDDNPDFHIARFAYWQKRLQSKEKISELEKLEIQFKEEFKNLDKKYSKDYNYLNTVGKTYVTFLMAINKILGRYYEEVQNKIVEICEQVPEEERSSMLNRVYKSEQNRKRSKQFQNEMIGKEAPQFEFVTIYGDKKELADFKGKFVLLDFWGTWCGPCVAEIPNLKKAYEKFKDKGFEIISVSSDLVMNSKTEEEFKYFVENKKMNWTHTLDSRNKKIHNLYKISHWPTLYLVDENGIVIHGENVLRGEKLEETLSGLLK